MYTNLAKPRELTKPFYFTTTVQINDCNTFPLMVKADMCGIREDEGWTFDVCSIETVELQMADRSIDITKEVSGGKLAKVIETHILLQEDHLYNEVAEMEEAV